MMTPKIKKSLRNIFGTIDWYRQLPGLQTEQNQPVPGRPQGQSGGYSNNPPSWSQEGTPPTGDIARTYRGGASGEIPIKTVFSPEPAFNMSRGETWGPVGELRTPPSPFPDDPTPIDPRAEP